MNLQTWHQPKYSTNVGTIKSYNDNYFKLTHTYTLRNGGYEQKRKFVAKGEGGNDAKLCNNISRAKATVFELAMCNPWEWFVTFTLDGTKKNRYELKEYSKALGIFIQNYNRNHDLNISYMLIPEKHLDGAWHMHGFFMGLPERCLQQFSLSMTLPVKIRNRIIQGKEVFTWKAYENSFGYCSMERIEQQEAAAKYITKYISKDLSRSVTDLNAKMYYCSKKLQRSEIVHRSFLEREIESPDYKNEYCAVKVCESLEEAYSYFLKGEEHGENDFIG